MSSGARFPLLGRALAALVCGVWAGLLRFGWSLPRDARPWSRLRRRVSTPRSGRAATLTAPSRPVTAVGVADSSELLRELRGLCDRLPVPHEGWHPYVPLIRACRTDLERAVAAAEARPATADLAETLIAGELELDFDRDSPELTAAYDRLRASPS